MDIEVFYLLLVFLVAHNYHMRQKNLLGAVSESPAGWLAGKNCGDLYVGL